MTIFAINKPFLIDEVIFKREIEMSFKVQY